MIGNGYGSEFHLLRWMGRHRELFNQRVSTAVGRPGSVIKWMDLLSAIWLKPAFLNSLKLD